MTSPPFVLVRFFIFLNDGIHGIPFCFHVRYQFKLCPASVQVVILNDRREALASKAKKND